MPGRMRAALAALLALLVVAPPVASAGPERGSDLGLTIGVVPQRTYGASDTKAMTEAGVGSVRVWFAWMQVERTRGTFDWQSVDDIVATNAEAGLTTMPYLFGTPAWAAALDDQPCFGSDCAPFAPRSEVTREAFADFAAAAVRRYGPDGTFWAQHHALPEEPIDTWQIWNEQNLSSFYAPAVDPAGYGALVQSVAPSIRAEDPQADIVLGGLTGTKSNERRMSTASFLTQLYAVPNIVNAFDGIAVHPYNRFVGGTLDQVRTARAIADAHADDVGLWVTEMGWASAGRRRWGLVKSPSGQARMLGLALDRLSRNADRWDIRAAYWYAWRDTDRGQGVCGWCPWSGLLDRIGREKPAYRELQRVTGST